MHTWEISFATLSYLLLWGQISCHRPGFTSSSIGGQGDLQFVYSTRHVIYRADPVYAVVRLLEPEKQAHSFCSTPKELGKSCFELQWVEFPL
jgi:hypothetical protein